MKEKLIGNFAGIVLNVAVEVMVTLHCESTSHRWWNLPLDNRTMYSWTLDHAVVFLTTSGLTSPSLFCMITVLISARDRSCTVIMQKSDGPVKPPVVRNTTAWSKVQDCMVRLSNGRFHNLWLVLSQCRVTITSTATLSTMPVKLPINFPFIETHYLACHVLHKWYLQ